VDSTNNFPDSDLHRVWKK